jgi:hypothetical protein
MKKCPFNKFKLCRADCELYVQKSRVYTGKLEAQIISGCALRIGSDEEENTSNKLSMIHKETGENKNIQLYTGLSMMGSEQGWELLKKKASKIIGEEDAKAIT